MGIASHQKDEHATTFTNPKRNESKGCSGECAVRHLAASSTPPSQTHPLLTAHAAGSLSRRFSHRCSTQLRPLAVLAVCARLCSATCSARMLLSSTRCVLVSFSTVSPGHEAFVLPAVPSSHGRTLQRFLYGALLGSRTLSLAALVQSAGREWGRGANPVWAWQPRTLPPHPLPTSMPAVAACQPDPASTVTDGLLRRPTEPPHRLPGHVRPDPFSREAVSAHYPTHPSH
jgi:hypothetical protein